MRDNIAILFPFEKTLTPNPSLRRERGFETILI
jgi:hypothetical protein